LNFNKIGNAGEGAIEFTTNPSVSKVAEFLLILKIHWQELTFFLVSPSIYSILTKSREEWGL
jgi:hypothetical protein